MAVRVREPFGQMSEMYLLVLYLFICQSINLSICLSVYSRIHVQDRPLDIFDA